DARRVRARSSRAHPRLGRRLLPRGLVDLGRGRGPAPHRARAPHCPSAIAGAGMIGWQIVAVVALLAANALFVAKEFALVASRRTKLEGLAEEGSLSGRLAFEAAN